MKRSEVKRSEAKRVKSVAKIPMVAKRSEVKRSKAKRVSCVAKIPAIVVLYNNVLLVQLT